MKYIIPLFSKIPFIVAFLLVENVNAQTEIKGNAPFLPLGMITSE